MRPSLYIAARTSTMDERIRIRGADHVSMKESRYGSTTLIFMYRGRCRRLCSLRQPEQQRFSPDKFCLAPWMPLRSPPACSLRRYLNLPIVCCASNAFNRPSSSVSGQTSSALHHGCLGLRGHTNQRLRSHALYEGIQHRHREDRHRWRLVFYTYATPSRLHEHAQLHYYAL